jgi:hypothetical protein
MNNFLRKEMTVWLDTNTVMWDSGHKTAGLCRRVVGLGSVLFSKVGQISSDKLSELSTLAHMNPDGYQTSYKETIRTPIAVGSGHHEALQ